MLGLGLGHGCALERGSVGGGGRTVEGCGWTSNNTSTGTAASQPSRTRPAPHAPSCAQAPPWLWRSSSLGRRPPSLPLSTARTAYRSWARRWGRAGLHRQGVKQGSKNRCPGCCRGVASVPAAHTAVSGALTQYMPPSPAGPQGRGGGRHGAQHGRHGQLLARARADARH